MMNVSAFGSAYIFLFVGWGRVDGVWGEIGNLLCQRNNSLRSCSTCGFMGFSHMKALPEKVFLHGDKKKIEKKTCCTADENEIKHLRPAA